MSFPINRLSDGSNWWQYVLEENTTNNLTQDQFPPSETGSDQQGQTLEEYEDLLAIIESHDRPQPPPQDLSYHYPEQGQELYVQEQPAQTPEEYADLLTIIAPSDYLQTPNQDYETTPSLQRVLQRKYSLYSGDITLNTFKPSPLIQLIPKQPNISPDQDFLPSEEKKERAPWDDLQIHSLEEFHSQYRSFTPSQKKRWPNSHQWVAQQMTNAYPNFKFNQDTCRFARDRYRESFQTPAIFAERRQWNETYITALEEFSKEFKKNHNNGKPLTQTDEFGNFLVDKMQKKFSGEIFTKHSCLGAWKRHIHKKTPS